MKVSMLVIDNDLTACKRIKYTLQTELTEVYYASSIQEALHFLSRKPFTVIILNVALSQERELIEAMIRQNPEPLVVLSCNVSVPSVSAAKPQGISSIVGTPYDLKTGLRKAIEILQGCGSTSTHSRSYMLAHGSSLVIDPVHRQAMLDGQPMELTRKNYELLFSLTKHAGTVATKETLFEEIWQAEYDINADDAIKFQVKVLRQKFGELGHSDLIETIWGVGYKLHAEEEKS